MKPLWWITTSQKNHSYRKNNFARLSLTLDTGHSLRAPYSEVRKTAKMTGPFQWCIPRDHRISFHSLDNTIFGCFSASNHGCFYFSWHLLLLFMVVWFTWLIFIFSYWYLNGLHVFSKGVPRGSLILITHGCKV